MAKEMVIIFVYDTQLLKKEEDDPASAILYFHPSWVSDQQRTALCGQIMGTVHCLKSIFSCPKIVSLQSGKFNITEYGRYTLAVGTDRNISNWVLEHRTAILTSLISFFHQDLEAMAEAYKTNSNLSAKLYHMFETYLKILMYDGNIFSNIVTLQLPKSASNVFLEAIQILQCFQDNKHILGGVMLYHNKVVATQLSANLTKYLVLTDPYRIKSPAEVFTVDYQLPLGVQLLQVYIDSKEYKHLQENTTRCRTVYQYLNKKNGKKATLKSSTTKEPVISAMKRDQSLIFTSVPEEETDHHNQTSIENISVNIKPQNRPKFLNLRNKTTDVELNDKQKEDTVLCTPFRGQTSVCSTPMTEIKKVLHPAVMSICTNPNQEDETNAAETITDSFKTESVNSILSAVSEKSHTSLHSTSTIGKLFKLTPYVTIERNLYDSKRFSSMWEVREKTKTFSKRITMKYYAIGPRSMNKNLITSVVDVESPKKENDESFKTITDPTFPVFRWDGTLVSQALYESHVKTNLDLYKSELNDKVSETNTDDWKSLEDFDSCLKEFSKKNLPEKTNEIELQSFTKPKTSMNQNSRKSLSLPLKSLTSESSDQLVSPSNRNRCAGGVQLTPLMSKLSLLAMVDKLNDFCSSETTPSDCKNFRYTPTQANYSFAKSITKFNSEQKGEDEFEKKGLQKCVLFVCGQQDMVVNVLLEEDACRSPEIVNKLWETCTECLGKLERQLQHCLETYPGPSTQNTTEAYSYLCLDPEWNTIQRGGPWGANELGALTHLHRDFTNASNLMEIILRDDDSIIYGHHYNNTEVYYHQPASSNAGLPTPADPMGTVPQKAKRRLERDHAVMLL